MDRTLKEEIERELREHEPGPLLYRLDCETDEEWLERMAVDVKSDQGAHQ